MNEPTTAATALIADAPAERAAEPRIVTVEAGDFFFQAPERIPAGMTTFRMTNKGQIPHHLVIVRIPEGHTYDELIRHTMREGMPPRWATFVGGPNTLLNGRTGDATVDLEAGEYGLLCFIPVPDGVPHLMKGMSRPLTVTPGQASPALAPEADVRLVMDDYSFEITPRIRTGLRTIQVENAAAQPHEIDFVRLAPGRTADDLLRWFENGEQGPPPGEFIGGMAALSHGEIGYLTKEFAPGEYALVCYVPDAKDGRRHLVHGMIDQITVEG